MALEICYYLIFVHCSFVGNCASASSATAPQDTINLLTLTQIVVPHANSIHLGCGDQNNVIVLIYPTYFCLYSYMFVYVFAHFILKIE